MQNTGQPQATPAKKPRAAAPQPVPPPEFQTDRIDKLAAPELIGVLKNAKSSTFEKAKAAQRLGLIGDKEAVPALVLLLNDPQLNTYGRQGLESIPDPAADDALRAAIPKLKGNLLIGVVNSLGQRRDPRSVPTLSKMMYDADPAVAQAAAAAVGKIGGAVAAKSLQDALTRSKGPTRTAIAHAALECADTTIGTERAAAMSLYNALTAPDIPKPVRLGAMQGIIRAENALSRPR